MGPVPGERARAPYRPEPGRYDELVAADGSIREPWQTLAAVAAALPEGELVRRRHQAERLLLADGASHVLHGGAPAEGPGPAPGSGPWPLDPVPFVLAAAEWEALAAGLTQRARLLTAVLADVYGPRRLFTDGALPVEAGLGYRGFLPAAAGPMAGRRHPLPLYGADVVRTADGRWAVLRDRTDAPVGLGYALVTRRVLARSLAEAFAAERVSSLAPFAGAVRDTLAAQAPPDRLSPRVVILSPGYRHPHYFEHSYLSTQLGYHLAEGPDLTVRDGRVWLRALGGLEAVDVVFRRVDDLVTDPLAGPRGRASAPGVPGLVEAVRAGGVGVANPPGSGVGETLALAAYLPALARHLLGEDLTLASVATRWCGDPDQRDHVLAHLDRLVLHHLDPFTPETVFGDHLDGPALQTWRRRLATVPHTVAAQERVRLATAPGLGPDGRIAPVSTVLRFLLTARGDSWEVLPGGMAGVVADHQPVLAQTAGPTKDVWVLAPLDGQRESARRGRPPLPPIDLRASLPTRVAEALYWSGRNAERAEQAARLARVLVARWEQSPDLSELGGPTGAPAAVLGLRAASGGRRLPSPALGSQTEGAEPGPALAAELADALAPRPASLVDSLDHLVAATATVREYLSNGTWRLLGQLAAERDRLAASAKAAARGSQPELEETLDRVLVALVALAGLEDESMTRGPGWRFLQLGRRLERAVLLGGVIEATLGYATDADATAALGELVLEAEESLVVYRRRFRSDVDLSQVLELLLADETNPRGFTYCLDRLREHLAALPWRHAAEADAHLTLVDDAARALLDGRRGEIGATVVGGRRVDVDRLVLAARGPVLELGNRLVVTWFADRAGVPSRRWEEWE